MNWYIPKKWNVLFQMPTLCVWLVEGAWKQFHVHGLKWEKCHSNWRRNWIVIKPCTIKILSLWAEKMFKSSLNRLPHEAYNVKMMRYLLVGASNRLPFSLVPFLHPCVLDWWISLSIHSHLCNMHVLDVGKVHLLNCL